MGSALGDLGEGFRGDTVIGVFAPELSVAQLESEPVSLDGELLPPFVMTSAEGLMTGAEFEEITLNNLDKLLWLLCLSALATFARAITCKECGFKCNGTYFG